MKWQEVCEHPSLRNLPFKIETDEHGDLIMSPAKIRHGFLQGRIGALLARLRNDGEVIQECALATPKGTKVADVAWVILVPALPRLWMTMRRISRPKSA